MVEKRRQRPRSQRVPVLAVHGLREVQVTPAPPDVADQLMPAHVLAGVNDGADVPVPERASAAARDRDVGAATVHVAGCDGVHLRPVGGGDVDAEMEGRELPFRVEVEPGIVERPTDRVRLVERPDRPRVRGGGRGGTQRSGGDAGHRRDPSPPGAWNPGRVREAARGLGSSRLEE